MILSLIKGPFERVLLTKVIGRILWPPVSVAVLAEGENDDYLTLKAGTQHELPGGILKSDEDLKNAARREVREETGFEAEIEELLDIHNRGGITFFFRGRIVGGEKNGSWEGEPEFVPREEMKEKEWRFEHSHIHEYLFPEK